MSYYKQSRKKRIAAAVIVVVLVGCMLATTLIASFILRWIERRMDGNDSYELVQADSLVMGEGMYEHPDRGTPFDEYSKQKGTLEKASEKERRYSSKGGR